MADLPAARRPEPGVAIRAIDLVKVFGPIRAVDGIGFDLGPGVVVQAAGPALLGELVHAILIQRPDHGVWIGQRIPGRGPARATQQRPGDERGRGENQCQSRQPEAHGSSTMARRRARSCSLRGSAGG